MGWVGWESRMNWMGTEYKRPNLWHQSHCYMSQMRSQHMFRSVSRPLPYVPDAHCVQTVAPVPVKYVHLGYGILVVEGQ